MKLFQSLFAISMFTALSSGVGCGTTSNVVDNGVAVTGVEVTPNKDGLTKGAQLQFAATVDYADGTHKDVTRDSSTVWNTSDPNVATVSADGMVTAVKEGAVDISADYKGEKGNEHFVVTP